MQLSATYNDENSIFRPFPELYRDMDSTMDLLKCTMSKFLLWILKYPASALVISSKLLTSLNC